MSEASVADEDWAVLLRFLPEGWEEQARLTGALRRTRAFRDPESLLRALLVHLAQGCSLRETAARVSTSGLANVSDVALWKRLKGSQEWFRWLSEGLLERMGRAKLDGEWAGGYRVLLVDASTVSEPGSTGTDWRLHYSLLLENLQCDHFEITDVSGGETLRRFPVHAEDLIIADRGYAQPPGIRYVSGKGGDTIIRLNLNTVPLETRSGRKFSQLSRLKRLRIGQAGDWDAVMPGKGASPTLPVRVCAIKKSREATEQARRKLHRRASKKGQALQPETVEAAAYVVLLTTAPSDRLPTKKVLELYRARWQVELAFKRMKSIVGLGHLPKTDPESARAWLHGKIFVSLLTEAIVDASESFFPWGYPISE